MSDQSINYVVTATDTASPAFEKVDKAIEKTTKSTHKHIDAAGRARFTLIDLNRVVQDAPFGWVAIQNNIDPLISSFQALRLETKSTGGAFKMIGQSLMGPAGIISLVSIAVSAFTAYTMATGGMHGATKKAAEENKKLAESFNEVSSSLNASIFAMVDIEKKIKELVPVAIGGTRFRQYPKGQKAYDAAVKEKDDLLNTTKGLLEEYKKFKSIIFEIYAGDYEANSVKKVKDAVKALTVEYETATTAKDRYYLKSQIDQYNAALDKMLGKEKEIRAIRRSEIPKHMGQAWTSMWARSRVPRVLSPSGTDFTKPEITSMSEAEFRNLTVVSNAFVDTFRQNFIGAWEDAFGRANSLFEQLLQNIAGGLMDLMAQQASNAIFSFLATAITGVPVPMGKVSGGSQIVIENKLGEDTFERGVYKSYGGASQRYKKVYRG